RSAEPAAGDAGSPEPTLATVAAQAPPPQNVAALVNGEGISMARYEAELRIALATYTAGTALDESSPEGQATLKALRQQVLEWMIDRVLINQAAARAGIAINEARVDSEVERIRGDNPDGFADWLQRNGFTEESFREQVRSDLLGAAMRERVTAGISSRVEQVHLRQIVVAGEAEARGLLEKLRAGNAGFEDLARTHSIDEGSRESGGDLGFVPRGILPESVERVAFGLEPGEVAGPIHSVLGWHLIQLVERDVAREVPPEILETLRQEAFMRWLEQERERAQVLRYVTE
ncbi:MAG: peptidylprolyl isomerase, partial [Anaerolineae bacterium]|nr:peptidylprolyl isomerase [Anaerolineae bacterium]